MKVLIAGYYGFGNLGDELILSAVASHLRERSPDVDITVLSARPEHTRETHGLNAVSRWNPWRVWGALWDNDALVLGGGGLLQDGTSIGSVLYYLSLIAVARLFRSPVLLYALGVEKLSHPLSRIAVRALLGGSGVTITVRDARSHDLLVEIGIPDAAIHVTADPVFTRPVEVAPAERYRLASPSALLVPRFPCPSEGRALLARIATVLREEHHMSVRGMLFQPATEAKALKNTREPMILPEEDFFTGEGTLDAMSGLVASFDYVVSARFHGLVLAALAGRPFMGVGDPDKVGRICSALGMPCVPWHADENDVQAAVTQLLSSPRVSTEAVHRAKLAAEVTAAYLP